MGAFYEKFDALDPKTLVEDSQEAETNPGGTFIARESDARTVMVAAVVISDLDDRTEAALRTACRAGFAYALDVAADELQITLEFNEKHGTVTAMANATEDTAMFCDSFLPVEDMVESMVKRTMPANRRVKVKVQPSRQESSNEEIDNIEEIDTTDPIDADSTSSTPSPDVFLPPSLDNSNSSGSGTEDHADTASHIQFWWFIALVAAAAAGRA